MYTPLEFTNPELQWGPGAVSETVGRQRMCAGYKQLSSPISPIYLSCISQHLRYISPIRCAGYNQPAWARACSCRSATPPGQGQG